MDRDQILLELQIFLWSLAGTGCNKQTLQQAYVPNIIYIMAGVESPSHVNGLSFLPELLGNSQSDHEFLYWEYFKYHFGWQPGDEGPRNHFDSQAVRMGEKIMTAHRDSEFFQANQ